MDGSRFDAWTRRGFALVSGSTLIALIGPNWLAETEAKKDKKNKRCRKLGRSCGGKRKCCGSLSCETVEALSRKRCCHQSGESCQTLGDCCGFLFCNTSGACELPDSDRNLKTNFGSVDPADMLSRVRELPISTWNYTRDDPAIRHIGPMAQDFTIAFGVGSDDRHIHPLDGQGVALAAIQGLIGELEAMRADNAQLAERLAALERKEASLPPVPSP